MRHYRTEKTECYPKEWKVVGMSDNRTCFFYTREEAAAEASRQIEMQAAAEREAGANPGSGREMT